MQSAQPRLTIRATALICLLCAVAGSVDAVAYLLCGRVFVANMTGGTVLLAISLLQGQMGEAALRGGLVAAFLVGVVVARYLARTVRERLTGRRRIFVLIAELIVLLMLTWKSTEANTPLLLLLLAVVLGVQNGAFRYIGGIHLNTTFITGDLELLGEAIMDRRDPLPKASAFLLSWVAYAGGAFLGALGARDFPQHAFLVPALLVGASIVAVALGPQQP
jgi:uncharacterized membrane protein YoaK (UPF0700 family)